MLGSIEAGGTKFVCATAKENGEISKIVDFPTTTPSETLALVIDFFRSAACAGNALQAVGIGCFGPLDLDPASARFGSITATPKQHWQNVNVRDYVMQALGCPVAIDTDVNAAGLAEAAEADVPSLIYVTVGTGIGAGLIRDGRPLQGLSHPEMGHVRVRRHAFDLTYPGLCPFHGDCLEGLASGAAIFHCEP
jgi:fructokinase